MYHYSAVIQNDRILYMTIESDTKGLGGLKQNININEVIQREGVFHYSTGSHSGNHQPSTESILGEAVNREEIAGIDKETMSKSNPWKTMVSVRCAVTGADFL